MNGWKNVAYTYNDYYILWLATKKKWGFETRYNTNESWKHYAKWNKSDTKGQMLCEFMSVKY